MKQVLLQLYKLNLFSFYELIMFMYIIYIPINNNNKDSKNVRKFVTLKKSQLKFQGKSKDISFKTNNKNNNIDKYYSYVETIIADFGFDPWELLGRDIHCEYRLAKKNLLTEEMILSKNHTKKNLDADDRINIYLILANSKTKNNIGIIHCCYHIFNISAKTNRRQLTLYNYRNKNRKNPENDINFKIKKSDPVVQYKIVTQTIRDFGFDPWKLLGRDIHKEYKHIK